MLKNYYDDARKRLEKSIHDREVNEHKQECFEKLLNKQFKNGINYFEITNTEESAYLFVKENKDELIKQGFHIKFTKGYYNNAADFWYDSYRIEIDLKDK